MDASLRFLPRIARNTPRLLRASRPATAVQRLSATRCISTTLPRLQDNIRGPKEPSDDNTRGPPKQPSDDKADAVRSYLGTTKRLPEFNLTDKIVLVSGAARGLGLTQAEALLEAGATVYALDRSPEPTPDFYTIQQRATSELGTSLHYRQIDVTDVPSLHSAVEAIADEHGRLDGLIAAAGVQQETPALEYRPEDANRMLAVNVTGVMMTATAAAKQMIRFGNGGSVVLIASMSGSVANRGMKTPVYNASKGAVLQLGRSLAMEWGQYGIRVNTLSPGYILTNMLTMLFEKYPEREENWPKDNMLGRFSTMNEYRGAACFLISDASSFMTGSDLRIDGGHCAW